MTEVLNALNKALNKLKEKNQMAICSGSKLAEVKLLDSPFATVNALIGGIPLGKFTTIAGPQHSGKGAFCMQLIAHNMQKDPNFICLWSDFENALDVKWAEKLGVDLDRLIVQKYSREKNTMESALDDGLTIIKETNMITMWVIDSIGALLPRKDIVGSNNKERTLDETNMLNLQKKLGEFFRKANTIIAPDITTNYDGCAIINIGQIYMTPDEYTPAQVRGGESLKHWAHVRLMFDRAPKAEWPERIEIVGSDGKKKKMYPGWAARIKLDKTRINDKEGEDVILTFRLGRGFDSRDAVISAAFGLNIFERKGAIYHCDLLPEGQIKGKEALMQVIKENDEIYDKLRERVNNYSLEEHIKHEEEKQETDNNNEEIT